MPLARTHSVALIGVTGHVVEVEADITNGLVGMILVGLPDTALREARDRIRAAIVNSGEEWPQRKITVGLSPASLPKRGSWFDLAIAVGILTAAGKVPPAAVDRMIFFGELGLDGRLRPVRGVLPAVAAAAEEGFAKVMVAEHNAAEAVLVPGVKVIAASSLSCAADWLCGTPGLHGGPPAAEFEGGHELSGGRTGIRAALWSLRGLRRHEWLCTPGQQSRRSRARSGRDARPVHSAASRRSVRSRRTPPVAIGAAWRRKDDAGRTNPHYPAAPGHRGGPGSYGHSFGGWDPAATRPPADRSALHGPTPHRNQGGDRRWWQRNHSPRLRVTGPPRRFVSR